MSTVSSLISKGEKQKPKFQSLDINKIYRGTRGENLEKTQQKSTIPYKHGMQSLGKVPNARRPPANLPSLKSEHNGSEAAVPLVPPGGPGWGKQDATSNGLSSSKTDSHQVSTPISNAGQASQISAPKQEAPHVPSAPVDKSWSSVMSRGDPHAHHPPPYQGAQFQHDFPSLSSASDAAASAGARGGDGAPTYSSGLSLRPQTEGSWIGGGGTGSGADGKPLSGHLGAPPQLSAQAGLVQQQQQQQQSLPPQLRGVMPSFMYKNSPPPPAPSSVIQQSAAPILPHETTIRYEKPVFNQKSYVDMVPPSIIKEEELHRMDEIEGDMGWAYSDDIDYNKKLSFSDDELIGDKSSKNKRHYNNNNNNINKNQERTTPTTTTPASKNRDVDNGWQLANKEQHSSEEEDIKNKRHQHSKELEMAVQRAKQRKKEEEKRFNEATKQGANKKLKELEEKISKRDRDGDEGVGTINPLIVPAKPIAAADIPLPDFQKEKEAVVVVVPNYKDERTARDTHDDKYDNKPAASTFKQLTDIDVKPAFRRGAKNQDRDARDQAVPTFSRQFQNNLPPRFKRQNNQKVQPQFDDYFNGGGAVETRKQSNYLIQDKKDETTPQTPEDASRKSESPSAVAYDFDAASSKKDVEKIIDFEKPTKNDYNKKDHHHYAQSSKSRGDNNDAKPRTAHRGGATTVQDPYDRFQDAKMSKYDTYTTWSDTKYDMPMTYEDRRRDGPTTREDRRVVPGPITRDRIEADDAASESRNLTALKRGQIPEKKPNDVVKNGKESKYGDASLVDVKNCNVDPTTVTDSKVWSDYTDKSRVKDNKLVDSSKKNNAKHDDYKDDKRGGGSSGAATNRNKIYSQNKAWNNDYHHNRQGGGGGGTDRGGNWGKKPTASGTAKHVKSNAGAGHTTDSEGSSEDHKDKLKNYPIKDENKRSRPDKGGDKTQDVKRDYVPRGEPSRHGRGGGNFRGRVGLSKRIDGYGPPPSKSPFSHHDDKKFNDIDADKLNVDVKDDDRNLDDKDRKRMTSGLTKGGGGINNAAPPRKSTGQRNDKKTYPGKADAVQLTDGANVLCAAIADISLKVKSEDADDDVGIRDTDGFQEVKSRKTVKKDEKPAPPIYVAGKTTTASASPVVVVVDKDKTTKKPPTAQPPIQQPTHNIPPLMATLVNPPHVLPNAKLQYDRQNRQNKIPPRFVKLRESNRLQKVHQQHNVMVDMKGRGGNMFNAKMSQGGGGAGNAPVVVPMTNAWDKPLSAQLRPNDVDECLPIEVEEHAPLVDADSKKMNKTGSLSDAALLDGATPPVTTIIFENTNFKSGPTNRGMRKEEHVLDTTPMSTFNKPMVDLLAGGGGGAKNDKQQNDSIQLQLPFKTEDGGDMKLDFFDSDLTLGDEKTATLKTPSCLGRGASSMHSTMPGAGANNISTADALNFKIQSVKKVWETPSNEHGVTQDDANTTSFASSFVPDPNSLDSSAFVKGNDNMEDNQEQHVYNPAANQQTSNNTTNVCKVKPTQQVSGASNQAVPNTSGAHAAHSGMMGPGLMGNPLSPPPIQPVIGAGVGLGQPPQQYPTNQHIGYQTGLGSSNQYGMSTIPSPPSVLPYTAQPLQAQTANLYGPFQIDQLGGQGRSQFSQYPSHYGLGQAASSPYSAQSMFLQTAQAHPPPAAQGPEIYQNMNNYRMSTGPFGQNQQLNNPTTVLISSTSNSLMSASVKPSTQQISAIGTKSGGVGQAYQQQSQQGQQMYMFDPNIPANYIQGASVLQRPTGPVQNNVVPTIQPSSSYYSGSTGTAKPFNCSWRF